VHHAYATKQRRSINTEKITRGTNVGAKGEKSGSGCPGAAWRKQGWQSKSPKFEF
jgi:hypothetical protein